MNKLKQIFTIRIPKCTSVRLAKSVDPPSWKCERYQASLGSEETRHPMLVVGLDVQ